MTFTDQATTTTPAPSGAPAARAVGLVKTYGMGDAVVTTSSNFGGGSLLAYNSRRVEFKVTVSATYLIEQAPAKTK